MKQVGGLRMWILHVIDENGPSNGVAIMDSVQKHYDWQVEWHEGNHIHPHEEAKMQSKRLLPGSIYPMLKKMVDEGSITKLDDGKYDLTEDGKIIVTNLFTHFQSPNKHSGNEINPIENLLDAMKWEVTSMEKLDKKEITHHKKSIESLIQRLKKLTE